jgi:hypothetical protein
MLRLCIDLSRSQELVINNEEPDLLFFLSPSNA